MRSSHTGLLRVVLGLALIVTAASAQAAPVDLKLVLAVDCSSSVDNDEFKLQIQGYATALTDPSIIREIAELPRD